VNLPGNHNPLVSLFFLWFLSFVPGPGNPFFSPSAIALVGATGKPPKTETVLGSLLHCQQWRQKKKSFPKS